MDRQDKYKIGLLSGILLFLFIPLLQNTLHFKAVKPLKGAYELTEDIKISKQDWLEGTYQAQKEKFLDQNFGLRNNYVRLNNQLDFTLFRKANVKKLVVGKGDFLFEDDYINAYYGNNFIGEKQLDERFKKLKAVQDVLSAQGILLEVVFAPGKATFYSEFIPDNWQYEKKQNNYEYAVKKCRENKIDYIDLNGWFLKQKNISPYDLYPKTGIHWSNYGALLAIDSLKTHIEQRSQLILRDFSIDNISFSDSLLSPDNDIGEAMNLLKDVPVLPMPYANYHWVENNLAIKPKALFIGDSYFWNIYYQGFTNNFFTDCKFWYYNETVYPEDAPERNVKKLNLAEELTKYKVIVLMATECNIHDIGWGFIEQVYDLYKEDVGGSLRKRIYVGLIIENIKQNKEWLADIERKAKEKNISVSEMITLDAVYIYKTEYSKPEVMALLDQNIERIRNSQEWMNDILKKALEKNVSMDEMIEMDAKYIYDTEIKNAK